MSSASARTRRTSRSNESRILEPLALASDLPPDVAAAIAARPSYPALFEEAFGDSAIMPVRIAFALATYERTLVADETPWDVSQAGGAPLSVAAEIGWGWFRQQRSSSRGVSGMSKRRSAARRAACWGWLGGFTAAAIRARRECHHDI